MSRSSDVCWPVLIALLALPACDPQAYVPADATERGWAVSAGGLAEDGAFELALDPAGNIIIAGQIAGWAVFGGQAIAPPRGRGQFVAKLDPAGTFLWALPLPTIPNSIDPATGWSEFRRDGLGTDPDGNIYFGSHFRGASSIASKALVARGVQEALIVKLDPNGRVLWAVTAGGEGTTEISVQSLAADASSVTVAGSFIGKPRFDELGLDSGSTGRGYAARLRAADGSFSWAAQHGGSGGHGVTIDADGAAFISCEMGAGTARFGEGITLTSAVTAPMTAGVLAKLDRGGRFVWAIPLPEILRGNSVTRDPASGDLIVQGAAPDNGQTHTGLARVDADGRLHWARKIGAGGSETGLNGVLVDEGGLVGVGRLTRKSTFGSYTFTSSGAMDVLRLRLDAEGTVLDAAAFGGMGSDLGTAVALDAEGNLYVTGVFQQRARFGETILDSRGGSDAFVWKIPRHQWRGSTPP